ncbi:carboxymethylenebutenolidase [Sphingobium sp. SYK-6]|uniref:dienelactone hydrolase family protein n=1 Tax=Sphingobium sp. (strain NBRC 103272 / SYK-6) TaxID=627192 RepID=UPI00022766EE|nr:dienelactone hydrolase family protein [Sphingobium sp. SYK-6]BAK65743.1 carboxymethylenebutenolidase [Sphingobium sp. SYK-6]
MSDYLQIDVEDGSFRAFVAYPARLPAPAVVVLHEVFGVNDDMRASCHELAERGFVAIAPDLFWRQEPGLDLSHWTPEEWEKGLALYGAYDRDQGARDIAEVITFARTLAGTTGKVGLMGYCLGGLMTFLVTARHGTDASVVYYPGAAQDYADEAARISAPTIVHLAEEDEFISPSAQAIIADAVRGNPAVEIFSYPGCNHAFARHSGTHYDAEAAALANGRTWSFFQAQLP